MVQFSCVTFAFLDKLIGFIYGRKKIKQRLSKGFRFQYGFQYRLIDIYLYIKIFSVYLPSYFQALFELN